jgi:hypothetical protein
VYFLAFAYMKPVDIEHAQKHFHMGAGNGFLKRHLQ